MLELTKSSLRRGRRQVISLLLYCSWQVAAAIPPQALDVVQTGDAPVSLTQYFSVLEDVGAGLTIADVSRPELASRFTPTPTPASAISYGFTHSAYWLRLELRNSGDKSLLRLLEISNALLSSVRLYQPAADGTYQLLATGNILPFASRAYPNRFFVFPLTLPPASRQVYYLRLQSYDSIVVPARLWTEPAFHLHERNDYLTQAWYFGMAAAMLLFNLLLFIALRDSIYLLYVSFVVCTAFGLAAQNGLSHEFFWPQATLWSETSLNLAYSWSFAALLLFMRRMLNVDKVIGWLDRPLRVLAAIYLCIPAGVAIAPGTWAAATVASWNAALVLILAVSSFCAYRRQRSAYFFLVAFAMLLFGGLALGLRTVGVLPDNVMTAYSLQMGSALEMLVLAFALADRYNKIRKDASQAQQNALHAQGQVLLAEQRVIDTLRESERQLERCVGERTEQLSATIERLKQTQADLVQADKLASLGALVAGVSHELNTPIGNALTTASALESAISELRASVQEGKLRASSLNNFVQNATPMAALIARSCQRAAALICSFKQVAVDQTSEERRVFDLRSLVDDNIAALRPNLGHTHWVIEVDIPAGILCNSYPGPLGQIIANLIQNAAVHAFEGRAAGSLRLVGTLDGEQAVLTFSDDGKGMEPAVLAHVFDPFYTTRLGQGGSGLGLSISFNIAAGVLAGNLSAHSEPERGSTFVLRFPLLAPGQVDQPTADNSSTLID